MAAFPADFSGGQRFGQTSHLLYLPNLNEELFLVFKTVFKVSYHSPNALKKGSKFILVIMAEVQWF